MGVSVARCVDEFISSYYLWLIIPLIKISMKNGDWVKFGWLCPDIAWRFKQNKLVGSTKGVVFDKG